MDSGTIFAELREKLTTGTFRPGERLKSESLRDAYGCSANTIRDVLFRLSATGLVSFAEQRGFRVTDTTPEQRDDVARFRVMLEREGATLSIRHGGLDWEARLAAAHHKLSHIESRMVTDDAPHRQFGLWSVAEWEFHDTLISACGSPMLRQTYANIYDRFRQQFTGLARDFGQDYFHAIIEEHQAIVDAALARDADRCATAIRDHMKRNFL